MMRMKFQLIQTLTHVRSNHITYLGRASEFIHPGPTVKLNNVCSYDYNVNSLLPHCFFFSEIGCNLKTPTVFNRNVRTEETILSNRNRF